MTSETFSIMVLTYLHRLSTMVTLLEFQQYVTLLFSNFLNVYSLLLVPSILICSINKEVLMVKTS